MEESGKLIQMQGLAEAALAGLRLLCQEREECEPGSQMEWERKQSQMGPGVKVEKGLNSD